jgi:1,4-alpha-glucan branching enzyme
MDFVLALHSHLPYVLNHGRWPHGTDWLTEAAVDTYLPLLETLRSLEADRIAAPVTIGFTPVLANQLASPAFADELEAFLAQRLAACDEAPASLAGTGDAHLLPLVGYWRDRLGRLRSLFRAVNGDLISAFRALEDAGRLEIIGSAATHGFLPLLGRDESIRFQLGLGASEHRRLFGREPRGCWLPECAYRPRGAWDPWPGAPRSPLRRGIDEHLADAGFRYFFVDAHLPAAGAPLGIYGNLVTGPAAAVEPAPGPAPRRSPYRAYGVLSAGRARVAAYVRDPRASSQVWSRAEGYPGDPSYLEFHKMRWPGGLKLWRVTGGDVDLGAKDRYDPAAAEERARIHGEHFSQLLGRISAEETRNPDGVIVAPFDTELFGHWWFEGPDFLGDTYRAIAGHSSVRPATGSAHLDAHPPRTGIRMPSGSWGANGDFSMWLSDRTAWTWLRLWPLEEAFWDAAPAALADPAMHHVLAQAARSLLLAQSSDWQFIISTGAVVDYAERRFNGHCDDLERLTSALTDRSDARLAEANALAAELGRRDDLFPDVLPALHSAVEGLRSRTPV